MKYIQKIKLNSVAYRVCGKSPDSNKGSLFNEKESK